jgi:hypothetical protein
MSIRNSRRKFFVGLGLGAGSGAAGTVALGAIKLEMQFLNTKNTIFKFRIHRKQRNTMVSHEQTGFNKRI